MLTDKTSVLHDLKMKMQDMVTMTNELLHILISASETGSRHLSASLEATAKSTLLQVGSRCAWLFPPSPWLHVLIPIILPWLHVLFPIILLCATAGGDEYGPVLDVHQRIAAAFVYQREAVHA
jgi:hypothetical protein